MLNVTTCVTDKHYLHHVVCQINMSDIIMNVHTCVTDNMMYVSLHFGGETYCFCPVRPSVRHTVCQRNSSETTEQDFMKLGR